MCTCVACTFPPCIQACVILRQHVHDLAESYVYSSKPADRVIEHAPQCIDLSLHAAKDWATTFTVVGNAGALFPVYGLCFCKLSVLDLHLGVGDSISS